MFLLQQTRSSTRNYILTLIMHAFSEDRHPVTAKETSLLICRSRGSLTLESAVVFPFVAAFFVCILFFFRVLQVETEVQTALAYTSRKVAAEAAVVENDLILLASAKAHMLKGLKDAKQVEDFVKKGKYGVSILKSKVEGEELELVANYQMILPFHFFPNLSVSVCQTQVSKKWTGDASDGSGTDDYVYVTKNGSCYHSSTKCKYLDLSIKSVQLANISGLRNEDDKKYYPCNACAEKNSSNGEVYITNYGTVYHIDINCIGLRRTIYMVHKSEVEGKSSCPKCCI